MEITVLWLSSFDLLVYLKLDYNIEVNYVLAGYVNQATILNHNVV